MSRDSLLTLWFHWTLASATAGSCLVGGAFWLLERIHYHDPGPLLGLVIFLGYVATLVLLFGVPQQLMLRRWVQYTDYWASCLPALVGVGSAAAGLLGMVLSCLLIPLQALVTNLPRIWFLEPALLVMCLFVFGAGFSYFQTPYLTVTKRGRWLWMTTSGITIIAFIVALSIGWEHYQRSHRWGENTPARTFALGARTGLAAGSIHGVITGAALVLLLRGHSQYPAKMRY